MVYIWAVEALGKGPSKPKTKEVCALFDVCCEKYHLSTQTNSPISKYYCYTRQKSARCASRGQMQGLLPDSYWPTLSSPPIRSALRGPLLILYAIRLLSDEDTSLVAFGPGKRNSLHYWSLKWHTSSVFPEFRLQTCRLERNLFTKTIEKVLLIPVNERNLRIDSSTRVP